MSEGKLQAAQFVATATAQYPHWTAYMTAVVVPLVGVLAAWIALRQSQIARNKLKLDLFERRMAVYEAVRNTLSDVTTTGKLSQKSQIDYLSGTSSAKWLFGEPVATYLEKTLREKLVHFELHDTMMSNSSGDERKSHIDARAETMKWLVAQYAEFDKLCAPYLKLKH